ncbi:MAG TPA: MFS transporter, partial [Bryobacteraceae bacterium]|nr:MFS transporter [Bryobacteraceae bacterium]
MSPERNDDMPSAGRLSGAAYAGMFVCGVMFALLGAVLPSLAARLTFTLGDIGTLFLVMNFAMLVTSLVLGVLMDRFGMKAPLALGPVLVAGALVLIARAVAFATLFPAVVMLGVGGGALNGATNTLVADLHDDPGKKGAALNLLGVFFGFGALLLPFSIGSMMAWFGVDGLLMGCAALCLGSGGFAAALRFPAPKQPAKLPMGEMPRFLKMPVVLAMAFLLFFQSGNEFLLSGYFTTFLTRELSLDVQEASVALAAYWASIMAARVALSRLLPRFDGHKVILMCALLAACGAAMVGRAGGVGMAVV